MRRTSSTPAACSRWSRPGRVGYTAPLSFKTRTGDTMKFDLAMTDELLATTRAVRKRLDLDRPVPREVLLECLELAVQAPTGGNSQGWRWLMVDDVEQRKALAELYRRAAKDYLSQAASAAGARGDRQT